MPSTKIKIITRFALFLSVWSAFAVKALFFIGDYAEGCRAAYDSFYPVTTCMIEQQLGLSLTVVALAVTMFFFLHYHFKMLLHYVDRKKSALSSEEFEHAEYIHKLAIKNYKSKSWNKKKVAAYVKEIFEKYLSESKVEEEVHPLELKPIEKVIVFEDLKK